MNLSQITHHVTDPRDAKNQKYSLSSLLLIVFSAAVSGYDSVDDIVEFAQRKLTWLQQFTELKRIPCAETLRHFLASVSAHELTKGFEAFVSEVSEDIISIDGKTMRGSRNSSFDALHILSAWSQSKGITLAALKSEGKKNEIKTIPKVLDLIELKGATVTLDAMGCQREIAQDIVSRGGDYILQIKNNQKSLNTEIQAYFHKLQRDGFPEGSMVSFEEVDKGHGRIEERKVHQVLLSNWVEAGDQWAQARSFIRVERTRIINNQETCEYSWYLSSLDLNAEKAARAIRGHWQIENNLHWQLDVTLNEDRYSNNSAAETMAIIKRFCLNLLKTNDESKRRIKQRIVAAAVDDEYRAKILLSG
ncbi:MAG TPA: ISAs1 family transposase [Marinagarivorans sp.]